MAGFTFIRPDQLPQNAGTMLPGEIVHSIVILDAEDIKLLSNRYYRDSWPMFPRLIFAVWLVLFCVGLTHFSGTFASQASSTRIADDGRIQTTGFGETVAIARDDAVRSALQFAVRQLVVSQTMIVNDEVALNTMASSLNGTIEAFELMSINEHPEYGFEINALISIRKGEIQEAAEKFAQVGFGLGNAKEVDGSKLLNQLLAAQSEKSRLAAQGSVAYKLTDAAMRGYPSRSMVIDLKSVRLDPDDTNTLLLDVEQRMSDTWLNSFRSFGQALKSMQSDIVRYQRENQWGRTLSKGSLVFMCRETQYARNDLYKTAAYRATARTAFQTSWLKGRPWEYRKWPELVDSPFCFPINRLFPSDRGYVIHAAGVVTHGFSKDLSFHGCGFTVLSGYPPKTHSRWNRAKGPTYRLFESTRNYKSAKINTEEVVAARIYSLMTEPVELTLSLNTTDFVDTEAGQAADIYIFRPVLHGRHNYIKQFTPESTFKLMDDFPGAPEHYSVEDYCDATKDEAMLEAARLLHSK